MPSAFPGVPGNGEAAVDNPQLPETDDVSVAGQQGGATETESEEASSPDRGGGSFDRDRALAPQKALTERLKKVLKGELEPGDEEGVSDQSEKLGDEPSEGLGDEIYREIAVQYERRCGRKPDLGDPHQSGVGPAECRLCDQFGAPDRGEGQGVPMNRGRGHRAEPRASAEGVRSPGRRHGQHLVPLCNRTDRRAQLRGASNREPGLPSRQVDPSWRSLAAQRDLLPANSSSSRPVGCDTGISTKSLSTWTLYSCRESRGSAPPGITPPRGSPKAPRAPRPAKRRRPDPGSHLASQRL